MLDTVDYAKTGTHKHRTPISHQLLNNRLLSSSLVDMHVSVYTTCPDKKLETLQPFLDEARKGLAACLDPTFELTDLVSGKPFRVTLNTWAVDGAAWCMLGNKGSPASDTPLAINGACSAEVHNLKLYIPTTLHEDGVQVSRAALELRSSLFFHPYIVALTCSRAQL